MPDHPHKRVFPAASVAIAALLCAPAAAAPDQNAARQVFAEAQAICERDDGALWGISVCGPIMIVDAEDRGVIASQQDALGQLTASGDVYVGTLPNSVVIANTPTQWSGTRWTQLVAPLPTDTAERHVILAHELFHRVQDSLDLVRPEAPNDHLDTLEGRYLLQLEWRALAHALTAESERDLRAVAGDVLLFRRERYRLFPNAEAREGALEITEGVAEYTGVVLGLSTHEERIAYALRDLQAFVSAPTFVRSFAYATGPAYGLLLDRADPEWRGKLGSDRRLDELLAGALGLTTPSHLDLDARVAAYDDGTLRANEERRETERRALQAEYRAKLVDGPVLVLPLASPNFQFNPQTLTPLKGQGTVFPTIRLTDSWGALEVEHGGALVRSEPRQATVSAASADVSQLTGDGWRLELNPGWEIGQSERPGDFVVRCTASCSQ